MKNKQFKIILLVVGLFLLLVLLFICKRDEVDKKSDTADVGLLRLRDCIVLAHTLTVYQNHYGNGNMPKTLSQLVDVDLCHSSDIPENVIYFYPPKNLRGYTFFHNQVMSNAKVWFHIVVSENRVLACVNGFPVEAIYDEKGKGDQCNKHKHDKTKEQKQKTIKSNGGTDGSTNPLNQPKNSGE